MNMAHNSPYDRGAADSYYRRGRDPHKMVDGHRVALDFEETKEYIAGYNQNERDRIFKEYE